MTKGIVEPAIEEPDVHAFVALSEGRATADQQRRVGNWLLVEGARLLQDARSELDGNWSTDQKADLDFAAGRRYLGILIREMTLPSTLKKARDLTHALHPEATTTKRTPRPTLSQRRAAKP